MTHEQILVRLNGVLDANQAQCLFATESGSRAWGFASANSDYDVRFVYWKSLDNYLDIKEPRDVIEEMGDDDLDFAGWDIKKALQLAHRSNPSLHDWLATPDAYFRHTTYFPEFKSLCLDYFDPNSGFLHFWSMATGNFERFSDASLVAFKKYFYVLRSLLCARYVQRHLKPAPCSFRDLLDEFYPHGDVRDEIDKLLELKKSGIETQKTKRNQVLHKEILSAFANHNQPPPKRELRTADDLSDFFRKVVRG